MFISTVQSYANLEQLKAAGVDAIILGIPHFSIRHCIEVNLDDLPKWIQRCKELDLKLFINCLAFCMEEELDLLRSTLYLLQDVDGIYYADEGVLYEALQLGMEDKLIYQPETLVASSADVSFYLEQGIQSVSLAHELSIEEIVSIAKETPNVEVLVSGYFSILYSRRPLITNYLNAIGSNVSYDGKPLELIEKTRMDRMPIVEDEKGTHVYSHCPIASFEEFEQLQEVGITRFRIDSIFLDDAYTCDIVKAYKNKESLCIGSNRWYHETTIKKKEGQ